jgi:hypothetical protein
MTRLAFIFDVVECRFSMFANNGRDYAQEVAIAGWVPPTDYLLDAPNFLRSKSEGFSAQLQLKEQ